MNNVSIKKNKDKEEIDEDIEIPEFATDDIKEKFPSLYEELSGESSKLSTKEVKNLLLEDDFEQIELTNESQPDLDTESLIKVVEKTKPMEKDYLRGFDPQAIDFIRRAKTVEEALEVLHFLEKRNELSSEDCQKLKQQLQESGLESFGEHKEDGYYFEYQRKKHMEEKMKLIGKADFTPSE